MRSTPPFPGTRIAALAVFGQRVDAFVESIHGEVSRRAAVGLGAIDSGEVLRSLMSLPHLLPVPLDDVEPLDRLVLADLPRTVVRVDGPMVTRVAATPVRLTGFVKHASRWEDVRAATVLRTHAPRLVVAPPPLASRVLREIDPDVGVASVTVSGLVVRRTPGRRWVKPSWQRWLIAETAFDALVGGPLPEDVEPGR